MPIITALRLESYIINTDLCCRQRCKIALTDKIFCKCVIRCANREKNWLLIFFLFAQIFRIISPYFGSHSECCPSLWPAGIECGVCENFSNFRFCNTVLFCWHKVIFKGWVGKSLCHKCGYCYEWAVTKWKFIFSWPYFTKKYIVIKFCKFRCKFSERISACGLFYSHNQYLQV